MKKKKIEIASFEDLCDEEDTRRYELRFGAVQPLAEVRGIKLSVVPVAAR